MAGVLRNPVVAARPVALTAPVQKYVQLARRTRLARRRDVQPCDVVHPLRPRYELALVDQLITRHRQRLVARREGPIDPLQHRARAVEPTGRERHRHSGAAVVSIESPRVVEVGRDRVRGIDAGFEPDAGGWHKSLVEVDRPAHHGGADGPVVLADEHVDALPRKRGDIVDLASAPGSDVRLQQLDRRRLVRQAEIPGHVARTQAVVRNTGEHADTLDARRIRDADLDGHVGAGGEAGYRHLRGIDVVRPQSRRRLRHHRSRRPRQGDREKGQDSADSC